MKFKLKSFVKSKSILKRLKRGGWRDGLTVKAALPEGLHPSLSNQMATHSHFSC